MAGGSTAADADHEAAAPREARRHRRLMDEGGVMEPCGRANVTALLLVTVLVLSSGCTSRTMTSDQGAAAAPDATFAGFGSLDTLYRLSSARSRSISPENVTGEKGKGGMAV